MPLTNSVGFVLPENPPTSVRLTNVVVPAALRCQRTVGAGDPTAAAVNDAAPPAIAPFGRGCVVMTSGLATVNVARDRRRSPLSELPRNANAKVSNLRYGFDGSK